MSRAIVCERRRTRAGFTIIEVLVALAVAAASLAAIGAVVATTTRAARSLEQRVALLQTARAVEAGLPRRGQLTPGRLVGEIGGHSWRVDVAPLSAGVAQGSPWTPLLVVTRIQSPSGAVLELNTVRLHRMVKQ